MHAFVSLRTRLLAFSDALFAATSNRFVELICLFLRFAVGFRGGSAQSTKERDRALTMASSAMRQPSARRPQSK